MTIHIISYPPGGGGNHLKNLCCLNGRFKDQWPWAWVKEQSVGLRPYYQPAGPQGEVHSLPGRNIHEVFVQHISDNLTGDYLLHGHFGELAAYAADIRQWAHVRWLVETMDDQLDRDNLRARQQRLQYHPYWLDEEMIYLYRPEMYTKYFGADPDHITCISVSQVWDRDLVISGMARNLAVAFGVQLPMPQAQDLHDRWCELNFPAGYDLKPSDLVL